MWLCDMCAMDAKLYFFEYSLELLKLDGSIISVGCLIEIEGQSQGKDQFLHFVDGDGSCFVLLSSQTRPRIDDVLLSLLGFGLFFVNKHESDGFDHSAERGEVHRVRFDNVCECVWKLFVGEFNLEILECFGEHLLFDLSESDAFLVVDGVL